MSEEVQVLAETETAPESEVTATTEDVTNQSPEADEVVQETQEERKFSQAELDAAISKRLAREQRKWEREQHNRQQENTPAAPVGKLNSEDFNSADEYVEALAAQKAEQLLAQREYQRQRAESSEAFNERMEVAMEKYDDFDQVARNPSLAVTDVMADAIVASEIGPDVLYHLGLNPKEATRISKLSPILQAKEIGKIEAKVADNPPVKKITSAPPPINAGKPRTIGSGVIDTTDPRSISAMSTSEWIEAERKRTLAKAKARQLR